jgi:hypothetical protein
MVDRARAGRGVRPPPRARPRHPPRSQTEQRLPVRVGARARQGARLRPRPGRGSRGRDGHRADARHAAVPAARGAQGRAVHRRAETRRRCVRPRHDRLPPRRRAPAGRCAVRARSQSASRAAHRALCARAELSRRPPPAARLPRCPRRGHHGGAGDGARRPPAGCARVADSVGGGGRGWPIASAHPLGRQPAGPALDLRSGRGARAKDRGQHTCRRVRRRDGR